MWTTIFICVFLGINANADGIDLSNDTSISIEVNKELAKIAATCLTNQDMEQLAGNSVRYFLASFFLYPTVEHGVEVIGLQELRSALKLHELPPWKSYNRTKPSERELSSATTIEEYYNLREPRSSRRSLDSDYFFESKFAAAVAFLDKRVPSIRTVFRRTFEDVCPVAPKVLNREEIDSMVQLYNKTLEKLDKSTSQMRRNYECQSHFYY